MRVKHIALKPEEKNRSGEKRQYDLAAALRILRQAGRDNPDLYAKNSDEQVQNIIDALCDLSIHDGMTGLVNATFFHVVLAREIERSLRTGKTCGLMVLDIDYFKKINDTYGHIIGDKVIQSFAATIMQSMRSMDTAARIGGEEFAVILPECFPRDAIQAAMRIHAELNPLELMIEKNALKVTSSVGLVWTELSYTTSSGALLSEADSEMYRAKRSGRARLCHPLIETSVITRQERKDLMSLLLEDSKDGKR